MAHNFEEVEAREIQILEKLDDIYHAIATGQLSLQTQINDVYSLLLIDVVESDKNERVNQEAAFRRNISACYQHLATINLAQPWRDQFGQLLNQLKEHATQTSKLPYYTHGDNDPQTDQLLVQSRRTDLFFGWMPAVAASVNYPLQFQYDPADKNPVIPNPLVWAEGAHTYARRRWPEIW